MKTKDVTTENSNVTSKEAVLSQQLSEALRLIRQLQRNNGELISQNANLMKTNSRLTVGNSNSMTHNDDESFVNDILSRITDNNGTVIENKPSVKDNSVCSNDNKSTDIDNKRSVNDSSFSVNDNNSSVNDNKPEQIEINGKMFDREWVLERLRFAYNVKKKMNLTDEQLLIAQKNIPVEAAKINAKGKLEKMRKVPALFYLANAPGYSHGVYEETFDKVLRAYRKLKYRNKKNTPSLARQLKMLLYLYENECRSPQEIFAVLNLKPITGFRYAAKLRKYGLINCQARGTSCRYIISQAGREFLENASL